MDIKTKPLTLEGLVLICAIISQTGLAMFWAGSISSRLENVEEKIDTRYTNSEAAFLAYRVDVLEARLERYENGGE